VIDPSNLFMDEEQYANCVKAILREMGSPFLITLYIGACVPGSDFEEIFLEELEKELTNRGVRGSGDEEPKGYWPLNDLNDEEVEDLGSYIEDCLPGYLKNWADVVAAVKAKRKNEAHVANRLFCEVKFFLIDPEKLGEMTPNYPTEWREWCYEWEGTAKDSLTAVNHAFERLTDQLVEDGETHLMPGIGWTIKEVPMN
jgi:hypothetical protein